MFFVQLPQALAPQLRQWCFRCERLKAVSHTIQFGRASSSTHTPYSLVFLLMKLEKMDAMLLVCQAAVDYPVSGQTLGRKQMEMP